MSNNGIIKLKLPEELKNDKNIDTVLIFSKAKYFDAVAVFLGRKNCIMIFRDDQINRIFHWHGYDYIKESCLTRNIIIINEEGVKLC